LPPFLFPFSLFFSSSSFLTSRKFQPANATILLRQSTVGVAFELLSLARLCTSQFEGSMIRSSCCFPE
jgi:hypothetical protein